MHRFLAGVMCHEGTRDKHKGKNGDQQTSHIKTYKPATYRRVKLESSDPPQLNATNAREDGAPPKTLGIDGFQKRHMIFRKVNLTPYHSIISTWDSMCGALNG